MKFIDLGILVIIIATSVYVRCVHSTSHFPHIDDIGVATFILAHHKTLEGTREKIITKETSGEHLSTPLKISKKLDQFGLLEVSLPFLNMMINITPQVWTYAPLQFYATNFFLQGKNSYDAIKFWGRLPSLCISLLGILLLMILLIKTHQQIQLTNMIFVVIAYSFSWQNIIYAWHMSNYAFGPTSAIALILILFIIDRKKEMTTSNLVALTFCVGILSYTHYQILFFIPAFFVNILFRKRNEKWIISKMIISSLGYCIIVYPMYHLYLKKLVSKGINNWNQGEFGQYSFHLPDSDFFQKVFYSIDFFATNIFDVLSSLFAIAPQGHYFNHFYLTIIIGLMILGCYHNIKTNQRFILFFTTLMATWMTLVIVGKITLSPTRHSLILLPPFCLLIFNGLSVTENFSTWLRRITEPLKYLMILSIFISFFISMPFELQSRRDPFDEKIISRIIQDHKVDTIFSYGATWNPFLMNLNQLEVGKIYNGKLLRVDEFLDSGLNLQKYYPQEYTPKIVAFISHRSPYSSDIFKRFNETLGVDEDPQDFIEVYSFNKHSETEIEFFKSTKNGTNGFFFTILKKESMPY
jgi:hypothetical protein